MSENELITEELRQSIQNTLKAVKEMMPMIRQEIREIINSRSKSERRIERTLDTLLNYLHWGFGEKEFKELNEYYYTVDKEYAAEYEALFNEMLEEDIVDPLVTQLKAPEPVRLNIEKEPLERIKKFLKALFEANLPGSWHRFAKLDYNGLTRRQVDSQMTYETFIANINKNTLVNFEINSKEAPPANPARKINVIRLFMGGLALPDSQHVERLAWHCTPIESGYFRDHPNYKRMDEIFKKVFDSNMESYDSQ
jgi:hypothetical protein